LWVFFSKKKKKKKKKTFEFRFDAKNPSHIDRAVAAFHRLPQNWALCRQFLSFLPSPLLISVVDQVCQSSLLKFVDTLHVAKLSTAAFSRDVAFDALCAAVDRVLQMDNLEPQSSHLPKFCMPLSALKNLPKEVLESMTKRKEQAGIVRVFSKEGELRPCFLARDVSAEEQGGWCWTGVKWSMPTFRFLYFSFWFFVFCGL
jgi:hypothetical protein